MFADEPVSFCFPVTLYDAPSFSANPSPSTYTVSAVSASPSYSFEAEADTSLTVLFVMSRLPFTRWTENWSVTSFPLSSVTDGVPVIFTGYVPACVPAADAAIPLTVYTCPPAVTLTFPSSSAPTSPLTLCLSPSYFAFPLFAVIVTSYFSSPDLLVTLSIP